MFKLYLKKLFLLIGFNFAIIGIYFLGYPIVGTMANFFQNPVIHYTILMGVPTFIVLILVYKGRTKNQNIRNDYMNYMKSVDTIELKVTLKNEIAYFKSFQSLHTEILAFATIMLPFVVAIAITVENEASFFANLLAGIILFSLFVIVYTILDILFWVFVHKKWVR